MDIWLWECADRSKDRNRDDKESAENLDDLDVVVGPVIAPPVKNRHVGQNEGDNNDSQ